MMKKYITLTPKGAFCAFLHQKPSDKARALQDILSNADSLPSDVWIGKYGHTLFAEVLGDGLIELVQTPQAAPKMALDVFLPHVVASLSGTRRAAIASSEGFCLAKIGYTQEEADRLCAAAADFLDFVLRQEARGLSIAGRAVSLFDAVDLLMPEVSFVFLWIDEMGYILIMDKEPLTNNQAFVELVWAIKTSKLRFTH